MQQSNIIQVALLELLFNTMQMHKLMRHREKVTKIKLNTNPLKI